MKPPSPSRLGGSSSLLRVLSLFLMMASIASAADRMLTSTSLSTCMDNSGFSATLFNVSFSPDSKQLKIDIRAESSIIGYVKAKLSVMAYGFKALERDLDPCKTTGLSEMCPMTQKAINITFQQTIPAESVQQIPGIAYHIPDLDGKARLEVIDNTGQLVACVEAPLSNGKSVDQPAVGWVTAVVAGAALVASAIVSGMGHSSTAAHVAANALSLFSYFQSQAMIAMIAVPLPPLVASWTQNYDWAIGIIRIEFMQKILHWYIQATGGTPENIFKKQSDVSVQIAKRSLEENPYLMTRAAHYGFSENPAAPVVTGLVKRAAALAKRSNNGSVLSGSLIRVTGIERMSYKAKIESTNFFMTGLAFFVAFLVLVALFISLFKWVFDLFANKMKPGSFRDFRNKWLVVLKGIMYRVIMIGFPQMAALCPWEWTHKDSPGAVAQSVFFFFAMMGILGWACFKIITLGRRVDSSKTTPAGYTLYQDPEALNRWGYLYIQYHTSAYYFVIPLLVYTLAKGFTIAFGQKNGDAQSIVLMIIELVYLVGVSWVRPWLDKRTNIVNIAIASVNFVNAVIVFLFSDVTNAPDQVPGVLGVVFFILNAVFALVLLVLVCISTCMALFSKDPESKFVAIAVGSTPTLEKSGLARSGSSNLRDLDEDDQVPIQMTSPAVQHNRGISPHRTGSIARSDAASMRSQQQQQHHDNASMRSQQPYQYPLPPSTAGSDSIRPRPSMSSHRSHRSPPPPPAGPGAMNWQVGAGYERDDSGRF
ncbi:DUF907 domain protein [Geopyxis carbonaria]|nr:DUF907 domain protein [Geopyxis carbonaria]